VKPAYVEHAAPWGALRREALDAGVAVSAAGATVRTSDGRELVDLSSGGFGYGDRRVLECVEAQMREMPLSSRHFLSRPLATLVERMARVAPGTLSVTYPCNSGSEAVEGALKLARGYRPGRTRVVAMSGAYHGSTLGARAVSDAATVCATIADAPVQVARVPYDDLDAAAHAIDRRTAAVIVEPVATGAGVRVPRHGYLTGLRSMATRAGALLIVDEVTTGLGRTGCRFAVEREGVAPDVLVVGGALGGGALPVAAYLTTRHVNQRVYGRRDPVLHASTTGGSPVACAAALAVLDAVEEEQLERACAGHGARLMEQLERWRDERPQLVLDPDGCGLLAGFRVRDPDLAYELQHAAAAAGALVGAGATGTGAGWIALRPPLAIGAEELERGLAALERALRSVEDADAGAAETAAVRA
jgi:acetylornithine/succinyldiaminopimelate/putrescine aminotransferase